MQIGLHVVSLEGRLIHEARTYILRCYACFRTTCNVTKVFCPKCGNKTLKKVSVSLNEDGTLQIHISTRKRLTARGKKVFSHHWTTKPIDLKLMSFYLILVFFANAQRRKICCQSHSSWRSAWSWATSHQIGSNPDQRSRSGLHRRFLFAVSSLVWFFSCRTIYLSIS